MLLENSYFLQYLSEINWGERFSGLNNPPVVIGIAKLAIHFQQAETVCFNAKRLKPIASKTAVDIKSRSGYITAGLLRKKQNRRSD